MLLTVLRGLSLGVLWLSYSWHAGIVGVMVEVFYLGWGKF